MTGAITTNSTFDGRDVSVDGAKLDNIASNANNYSLPTASSGTKGGITTNFTTNSTARNYKVLMSGTNAYVNVPWTDTTGSNNFLDGITKSGNTLTFSVNGTTNQTYTFGSNAFNSTSYLPLTGGTIGGTLIIDSGTNLGLRIEHDTFGAGLEIHREHGSNAASIKFTNNGGQQGILFAQHSDSSLRWRENTSTTANLIFHSGNSAQFTSTLNTKLSGIATNADVTPSWVPSSNPNYLTSIAANSIGAAELNVSGNGTAGYLLKSDGDGSFTWTANAIGSYTNTGDNRVITSTGSTGVNAEYGLTYDRVNGLNLHNHNGTGGLSSVATLTLGQSPFNSGISNLVLDSKTQGSIRFKDGSTVDASITYEGVISNKLLITSTNIKLTGTTEILGKTAITGTGTAGTPTFDIINSSSSTFNHTIEAMTPNMTANESNILVFGRESSTKNSGYIGYKYSSTASNNNVITIGHWGSDHLVTIDGVGNMDVAAKVYATQFLASGGDSTPAATTFENVFKGTNNNYRTAYFDGHGTSCSVWWGVGNNPHAALDTTDGNLATWANDSSGTWRKITEHSASGLNVTTGSLLVGGVNRVSSGGVVSASEVDLPSGGMLDWANGDARIVEGLVNNYSLSFQTYDGSNVTTALRLDGNNTATFTGTIANGQFTIPNSAGSAGQVLKWPSSGTTLEWGTVSGGSGLPSGMTYSSSILTVTGTIKATADVVAYHSSDARLKDNVVVIDSALAKVKQIRGVEFDWNDKQNVHEGHDIGVIAQDVEQVAPELVKDREDGYKAVDYPKLTALLIEAVKELELKVKELEDKQK